MQYLITGGAGFIGSHLADQLLASGNRVVILDNFDPYYSRTIKEANLQQAMLHDSCTVIEGDIRDKALLRKLLTDHGIELIVHLAAKAGVRGSLKCPEEYYDVNMNGTLNILEAMKITGVTKLVFASSSSVYGNSNSIPFREDDAIDFPISPYASTKRSGELLCHVYSHLYGLHISCLRFFTVYGPRQRPDLAIHKFTKCIDAGTPVPFYGDGSTARDYTYISDIVNGIVLAANRLYGYNIFNLGGTTPVSLRSLVKKLAFYLQKEPRLDKQPVPPGDVRITCGCIDKANIFLNFSPRIHFNEGLRLFVDWYHQSQVQPVYFDGISE